MAACETQIKEQGRIVPSFARIELTGGWSGEVLTGAEPLDRGLEGTGCHRLPTAEQWPSLLERIVSEPSVLSGYTLLKYSKHGEVFRARLPFGDDALDVVCKQSRVHGFLRELASRFRPTREKANFGRAIALLKMGIRTALPLARLERRSPRREAWLVTRYIEGLVDLDQVALALLPRIEAASAHGVKESIIDVIVEFVVALEKKGLAHRDLKASNILLERWDGGGERVRLWVVDLDGLRTGKRRIVPRRSQPLMRLAASLLGYSAVTRTDYGRFLKRYLIRTTGSTESWKRRFRALASQTREYRRRAGRRKSHKLDGYAGET